MPNIQYLTVADVIALHAIVMERSGYSPAPLRDEGALESAVMRPQMLAHYENADLVGQSASLFIGISQAQAFLDGNKRTAYMAGDVFLRVNRLMFNGEPVELSRQLELVAERTDSLADATSRFETWLREHVAPRNPQ